MKQDSPRGIHVAIIMDGNGRWAMARGQMRTAGHIEGARHLPLSSFARQLPDLPNDRPIALICGSGYRSSIATSLLQARGHQQVANVTGGMTAFTESVS